MKTVFTLRGWLVDGRLPAAVGSLACLVTLLLAFAPASWAQAQSYSVLYSFQCGPNDGQIPNGDLVTDGAGDIYGATLDGGEFGGGMVFKISAGGSETVLHSFAGSPADGALPVGGLARDLVGNLYGATSEGGAYDRGALFEVSATGAETLLHSFTGGKDEEEPLGNLLLDPAGNLYGVTSVGSGDSYGAVFKLSIGGKLTTLHSFPAFSGDGQSPSSGLIRDSASNLYGATGAGGAYSNGTVFELSKTGVETILYSFSGGSDGGAPAANLVRDSAGNLYGITVEGGIGSDCDDTGNLGCGIVFKVTPAGEESVLYTFTGGADGGTPFSDLVMDPKGNLYGTTTVGGSSSAYCTSGGAPSCGVVFEVTAAGKEKVLHAFTGIPDGYEPYGGLLRIGNYLYGTTTYGGTYNCGTVYRLTP